jgi:hypothetical protein
VDAAHSRLCVARRFCGPPGAANGGFASGSLAAVLGGTVDVEVSLRRPVLPVSRRSVWAAPWTPDPSVGGPEGQVRDEVVWAALDCPGGVAAVEAAALPAGTPVLLGQMTARLSARSRIGTEYRMVSWLLGRDGRKLTARPRTRRDEQPPGANVRTTAGGSG